MVYHFKGRDQELPDVGLDCLWFDVTQSCIANYLVFRETWTCEVEGLWRVRIPFYSIRFGRIWPEIPACSFVS